MGLERLLQIAICTLSVLGALLLAMGQRSPWLPLGMAVAATSAFWLTDVAGWVRANRLFINVGAIVALLASLAGARYYAGFGQVFIITNLLVYLQALLLFQKKDLRTYTLLLLLSVLQVIVSAAFEQEVWFGFLLFGYLFVGLSTLSLLLLYREHVRQQPAESPTAAAARAARWPLAEVELCFQAVPGGRPCLGRELLLRLLRATLAVSLVTLVVFLLMPRLGRGNWGPVNTGTKRTVGFAPRIVLGGVGQLVEDAQEVMRVQLWNTKSGRPVHLSEAIYLRGAVLDCYTQGNWSVQAVSPSHLRHRQGFRHHRRFGIPIPLAEDPEDSELTRQQITLEALDQPELFCVWPCVLLQEDDRLAMDAESQQLFRSEEWMDQRLSYELATPAVRGSTQVPIVPYDSPLPTRAYLWPLPTTGLVALNGLIALAEEWAEEEPGQTAQPYYVAKKLERQLRSGKRFRYSLKGPQREPDLDPIEDFITEHPVGHCEYFATALALMLRSRGIPSRLVLGYKCDEWNELGQFFQVRQLHAHSWVEAYLAPEDIPEDVRRRFAHWDWQRGAWMRLDPTPSSGELSLANRLLANTDRYFSGLDYIWNNYVAQINLMQQQQSFYGPATRFFSETGRRLSSPRWWQQLFLRLLDVSEWSSRLRWQVALGASLSLLAVALGWRLLRRWGWAWGRGRATDRGRRRGHCRPRVEFYRRLEAVLARRGLVRQPGETPREFAALARQHLEHTLGEPQLAGLPEHVVDAFYQVRFGGASLDRAQAQAVEQALRQLERAVRARR